MLIRKVSSLIQAPGLPGPACDRGRRVNQPSAEKTWLHPITTRRLSALVQTLVIWGTWCLVGVGASVSAQADDWPQRRGIGNDGISLETGWTHDWPSEGPNVLWKRSVGIGFSGVVVGNGRAFTAGNSNGVDTIWGLDASSGLSLWTFSYPEPLAPKMYEGGPNSTPTLDGKTLFVASKTAKVFRINASTGGVLWTNDLQVTVGPVQSDWGVAGSPFVLAGRVYLNLGPSLAALDAESGKMLWRTEPEAKGKYSFTTPVLLLKNETPYLLVHMHKALHTVSAATGKELRAHPFGRGYETHSSDPVIWNGSVFISSGDDGGELLDFTPEGPSRRWKNTNLSTFTGTAVVRDGVAYGVDSGGYRKGEQKLRCVDLSTGNIRWSLDGFGQDSWILAGDRLVLLRESGEIQVIRVTPEGGKIVGRAQVLGGKCWTQPSLANGLLYCRNAQGSMVCLDLRRSPNKLP